MTTPSRSLAQVAWSPPRSRARGEESGELRPRHRAERRAFTAAGVVGATREADISGMWSRWDAARAARPVRRADRLSPQCAQINQKVRVQGCQEPMVTSHPERLRASPEGSEPQDWRKWAALHGEDTFRRKRLVKICTRLPRKRPRRHPCGQAAPRISRRTSCQPRERLCSRTDQSVAYAAIGHSQQFPTVQIGRISHDGRDERLSPYVTALLEASDLIDADYGRLCR